MTNKCCNKTQEQCDCCKIKIDSFECVRNSDLDLPTLGIVPGDSGEAVLRKIEAFAQQLSLMTQGPEGPEGPQGIRGPRGCRGRKGDTGPAGEAIAGENGTNAFKYVKEVATNFNAGSAFIPFTEYTNCSNIPVGCLGPSTVSSKADLHIQLWYRNSSPVSTVWNLVPDSVIKELTLSENTGDISISLSGAERPVFLRIVILG